jgi:hypothetical protein
LNTRPVNPANSRENRRFYPTGKITPRRPDSLADDPVTCEPVSGRNSLLFRKCRESLRKCSEAQIVTEPNQRLRQPVFCPERDNYMGFRHGRTPCREALRGQVPIEVPNEFQATYSTATPWAAQHCPGIPALSGSKGRRRGRTDPVGRTQFKRRRDPAIQYFAVTGDPQIQITSIRGPNRVSTC